MLKSNNRLELVWDGPLQCPFQFTTVLTTLSPPIGVLTYCTCVLLKNEIVHLPLALPEVGTLKNRLRGVVFFKKKKNESELIFLWKKKVVCVWDGCLTPPSSYPWRNASLQFMGNPMVC